MRAPLFSFLPLLACVLMLPGCKRKLTDANLNCIKDDMNPKEVESILGQPTLTTNKEIALQTTAKTLTAQNYIYQQDGKTVVIYFVDGKLVAHDGNFSK